MLLGMDDWMVALAYIANILAVGFGVIYGAVNYNRGDDETPAAVPAEEKEIRKP